VLLCSARAVFVCACLLCTTTIHHQPHHHPPTHTSPAISISSLHPLPPHPTTPPHHHWSTTHLATPLPTSAKTETSAATAKFDSVKPQKIQQPPNHHHSATHHSHTHPVRSTQVSPLLPLHVFCEDSRAEQVTRWNKISARTPDWQW
jgi:hypothetical protein